MCLVVVVVFSSGNDNKRVYRACAPAKVFMSVDLIRNLEKN